MHYVSPKFSYAWNARHVRYLCGKLMAVERGEIKRLMVFMPPRHRKSQTTTAHFPAWFLGRNPDKYVMITSYGSSLAERFSKQARALTAEFGPELFGIDISKTGAAVDTWDIEGHYGGLHAVGVGGAITGRGAHLLIIDDPHRSRADVNSDTIRESVWEWYTSTAYTRLEPDGAVIVIQTRWHTEDLAGKLLMASETTDDYADQWEIVRFPAFAEEDDPLGRAPGDVLWPEEFGADVINRFRVTLGNREFTAQYQQRPIAVEGGAFQSAWFNWYTKNDISFDDDDVYFRGRKLRVYTGIDLATTEKTSSDDFAIVVIGLTDELDVLVLDVIHGQFAPDKQGDIVVKSFDDWLPERIAVEDNGGQVYFVSELKRWHTTHKNTPRLPVKGVTNTGDKYSRITRNVPFVESGGLWLRQSTDSEEGWVDMERLPGLRIHPKMRKLYEQLVTFTPKMAHEDVADAWDIAINSAARNGRFLEDWSKQAAFREPGQWVPGGAADGVGG